MRAASVDRTAGRRARWLAMGLALAVLGPAGGAKEGGAAGAGPPVEARSLLGRPLPRPSLPDEFRLRQEELLRAARARAAAAPDDLEAAIWVGRRTAYLGRYREAIEIYTRALASHPDSPELYRHRGHRLITVRRFDEAAADLERAARLIAGRPDEVEPDGLPNERNIPTSTLHSNVWYHLGLARYLAGEFEAALDAYRRGLEVSRNPDTLVAMSYWTWLALRRLGRAGEAHRVVEPIRADLDVIENRDYLDLLLLFRGDVGPDGAEAEDGDELSAATRGYGVGAWHLAEGRPERALAIFRRVIEGPSWPAFGYIAAEAELFRTGPEPDSGQAGAGR